MPRRLMIGSMLKDMSARKPILVLDIGGVLFNDPTAHLLSQISLKGGRMTPSALDDWYHLNIHDEVWSGKIDTDTFWQTLLEQNSIPLAEQPEWEANWLTWMQPMDAIKKIEGWSKSARICILSNHKAIWLRPMLKQHGIDKLVDNKDLVVSDEVGSCKPATPIFEHAKDLWGQGPGIMFVDDKPANLAAAEEVCGWSTIQADHYGRWIRQVDRWIASI